MLILDSTVIKTTSDLSDVAAVLLENFISLSKLNRNRKSVVVEVTPASLWLRHRPRMKKSDRAL